MTNAIPGTDGALSGAEADKRYSTAPKCEIQAAARAIEAALSLVPAAGDLGHRSRTRLALDLSDCLRRLDIDQIAVGAVAHLMALPPREAWQLTNAARADMVTMAHIPPDKVGKTPEIEAERQRRAWAKYCANRTPYERRRAG
jgi:hypothetical protein